MKLSISAILAASAAALMTAGCGTPAADNTSVPTTTKVNGKSVTLAKLAGGLEYYDITVGTGPAVKTGDSVSVQYTGTLVDGTKFDSSYDHGGTPFTFPVGGGQVIPGWDQGVPGMKVGGKRRLVIPGSLAYGSSPPSDAIPADATLLFDIDLVSINPPPKTMPHPMLPHPAAH